MATRKKSAVWDHFEKQDDGNYVVCLICKTRLSFKSSTTAMLRHVRTKHIIPAEGNIMKEQTPNQAPHAESRPSSSSHPPTQRSTQPTMQDLMEKKSLYPRDSKRRQELDRLVINMVVKDMQPFSVVDDAGFRALVSGLDSRYSLPGRKTITASLLPRMYEMKKAKLQDILRSAKDIAVTTDAWASRINDSYYTVTTHFINDNWELQSYVLGTILNKESHSAENIAKDLTNVFALWNIKDKVCWIVTDNAPNIVKACTDLKIPRIACFAHTLNLAVKDAIKATQGLGVIIKKVKDIVSHFNPSTKAYLKLKEFQVQNGYKERKLKQELVTRWNSTFYMLERFAEQRPMVGLALDSMQKGELMLTTQEAKGMQQAIDALRPFERQQQK